MCLACDVLEVAAKDIARHFRCQLVILVPESTSRGVEKLPTDSTQFCQRMRASLVSRLPIYVLAPQTVEEIMRTVEDEKRSRPVEKEDS